ncbi:hypothetical protein V5O48_014472 [Marasmius crinis-equi]|uniref:F-box domain-containing protein n=1 Tax=Marasmius crinis-equi TaxID=585013 RepID=A0ABR3EX80_9AGAR
MFFARMDVVAPQSVTLCERCNYGFTLRQPHPPISRDLIRSSHAIPNFEVPTIICDIEDEERDVLRCEEEIRRIKLVLARMVNQKRVLQKRILERRFVVSSIRRVPNELWAVIFGLCVPEHSLHITNSTLKERLASIPSILTQVCSRWRHIATSLSHLWPSIYIELAALSHNVTSLLEVHAKHAKGGFDIVMKGDGFDGPSYAVDEWMRNSEEAYSWFWNRLSRFRRCKFLELRRALPSNAPPNATFPLLEYLSLKYIQGDPPDWFLDAVHAAPNLRKLVLDTCHISLSPSQASRMFAHTPIQVLKADERVFEDLPTTLNLLPTLSKLEALRISFFSNDQGSLASPVICPSLRTLTIKQTHKPDRVLRSLELPFLQTLILTNGFSNGHNCTIFTRQLSSLLSLLPRFSSLTRFAFHFGMDETTSLNPLVEIMKSLPNLHAFDARFRGGEGKWGIDFLSSLASSTSFGSRLSSLILHESDCDINVSLAKEVVHHLETHLESRAVQGITTLANVRLVFERPFGRNRLELDSDDKDELEMNLRELEGRGMKVAMFTVSGGKSRPWRWKSLILGSMSLATTSFVESDDQVVFD